MVEIYGPESSGKTTLALHAIAEAQKAGLTCAFIDTEHALDISYAGLLGVDTDALLTSQPDCGEQALDIVDTLVRSGSVGLIVVDSVAALTPRKELEGDMGDSNMGLHARLMSQAMRKLAGIAYNSQTLVIWTNQIRMKIGVMFGSPETVTGGQALKFYASQRLDIRKIDTIKTGEEKTGTRVQVKVVKNKVGPPFKVVQFNIVFAQGIDWALDLLEVACDANLVEKSGAWYSYKGERIGQGAANTAKYIKDHPAVVEELRGALMQVVIDREDPTIEEEAIIED
jgi:recombination protein RecA